MNVKKNKAKCHADDKDLITFNEQINAAEATKEKIHEENESDNRVKIINDKLNESGIEMCYNERAQIFTLKNTKNCDR